MNAIPEELVNLINYCHSLAKLLLIEQGEFYPFGTYLNIEQVITQRMFHDGDDFPLSTGLIDIIKHDFDQQLAGGLIAGSAITYEASVTNEVYPESISVIVLRLNSPRLDSAILYYLPYRVNEGTATYLPAWVEAGH